MAFSGLGLVLRHGLRHGIWLELGRWLGLQLEVGLRLGLLFVHRLELRLRLAPLSARFDGRP